MVRQLLANDGGEDEKAACFPEPFTSQLKGHKAGGETAAETYHAIQEVQSSEPDRLIFVIQTLENEVLVRLNRLGMCFQDFGHRQQAQVFHCAKQNKTSFQI